MKLPLFISLALLTLSVCLRAEDLGSEAPTGDTEAEIDMSSVTSGAAVSEGSSFAPVVGYEPTYKFVVGAAYFYEQSKFSLSTDANWNFKNVYQFHLRFTHRIAQNFEYRYQGGLVKGFDPYYGEGGETVASDLTNLFGTKSDNRLQFTYNFSPLFSMGIFGDLRTRTEEEQSDKPWFRRFPNEATIGVGVNAMIDTRKNKMDPREGFVFNNDLTLVPGSFVTRPNFPSFAQVKSSFIVYQEVMRDTFPGVIAAFRLSGGYSWGEPSYMFKFRLGGADMLQGYLENRFRGRKFYLQQTELRFPIWKLFSGAALLGFGDATDGSFTNPKMAYGLGLRIGLPPDYVSKIRIDFGFGKDESGFFANFGHTF